MNNQSGPNRNTAHSESTDCQPMLIAGFYRMLLQLSIHEREKHGTIVNAATLSQIAILHSIRLSRCLLNDLMIGIVR